MIPKPTHRAVIDVGHKCNVKCTHCYYAHTKNTSFTALDCLKKEVDEAIARGNNYIDFTGGEPSIYPQMQLLIRYCTSKGVKTCIITNAIAGKNTVANILREGIDDWLISVHGTEETHNKIVQLKDARARQIRFIEQIKTAGGTFRFNCTLTRSNQDELIEIATWAASMKPRIFNFINFNPHHEWQNDVEGTKNTIADLRVVETQLNEAIAILEDAGIGVNLRYYPMCRINEVYRKCVCNDLQVMFDPYEWDYGITPKDYKTYYRAGVNISTQNEWKGQPCQSCDLKFMCGGLNSAFHRASGMKAIDAIKDTTVNRDDIYHYRRKNIACITDRVKPADSMCIAAIVDINMADYIPLFLYTAYKSFPDYDVKVFARFDDAEHDKYRDLVDQCIGFGYYDSCVVPVAHELTEFADNANVTRVLRFLKFEDHLKDYAHVLFTDIDMLFVADGDIVKQHLAQMTKDKTVAYENWCTNHQGTMRLSGVHFITHDWWNKTREFREKLLEGLKNKSDVTWSYDEEVLYYLADKAALGISPEEKRLWRHHAIHLGDVEYAAKNRTGYETTEKENRALTEYLCDKSFVELLRWVVDHNERFRPIAHLLNSTGNKKIAIAAQTANVPLKKKYVPKHHEGTLCVMCICDAAYQWYVPIFLKSLGTIREKQNITPTIYIRCEIDKEMLEACGGNSVFVHALEDDTYPSGGYTTAAMRFLSIQECYKYDYTLITDIDMLIFEETMTIVDQHMMHIERDGTGCFENWISEYRGNNEPRLPGVHFVTKDWWPKTFTARAKWAEKVKESGPVSDYWFDEVLLGRIVRESGLALPPAEGKLWRHHGVHLGDWRLNIDRNVLPQPDVFQLMHINWMLKDPEMAKLLDECGKRIELISKVKKMWPRLFI